MAKRQTPTDPKTKQTPGKTKKNAASANASSASGSDKAKPSPSTAASKDKEPLYPEIGVKLCTGSDALTAEQARKLLGWQAESEHIKFGNAFLLHDETGAKVRCYHNVTNRPLYGTVYLLLKQEHLRKRWQFNGEPIIIGRTGAVLNGQHQLVSLVLAAQEWAAHPGKWNEYWQTEPTMEKLVVFGVDESDDVVNTMDTCKPRSLADVIYRSEYFASSPPRERRAAATCADHAIRLLWHRTGAMLDAFAPRRTHAESLAFLAAHHRLLDAVRHVLEENGDNNITKYLPLGYAAALLYLMSVSATQREKEDATGYAQVAHPGEAQLDFARWDKACEFWVLLAAGSTELQAIRDMVASLTERNLASWRERCAILCKAWSIWIRHKPVTVKLLGLEFTRDEDTGVEVLTETPTVGGVDLGDPTREA